MQIIEALKTAFYFTYSSVYAIIQNEIYINYKVLYKGLKAAYAEMHNRLPVRLKGTWNFAKRNG